jgi:hypothetical protein
MSEHPLLDLVNSANTNATDSQSDDDGNSSPLKLIPMGRQPSFTVLSQQRMVAKGGMLVKTFQALPVEPASQPLLPTPVKTQTSYAQLGQHIRTINLNPTPDGRTKIVPISQGKNALMRSLRDVNSDRLQKLGYDPLSEGASPVWAGLSVLTDETIEPVEEPVITGLSDSLNSVLGPSPDDRVVAALKGEPFENGGPRDRIRTIFLLRRLWRHCADRALTNDATTVREAIDLVMEKDRPGNEEFKEEMRQIEEEWGSETKQAAFTKPSAALVSMRKTAQRMMAGGKHFEGSLIAQQIAELEAEEDLEAAERVADEFMKEIEEAKKKLRSAKVGCAKITKRKSRVICRPMSRARGGK